MDDTDFRLYLCSNCCRRCLWMDLSPQEHRCTQCRLPLQGCAICDRMFEPRDQAELYCKRCDFHLVKTVSTTPPPSLDLELEPDAELETELLPVLEPQPAPAQVPQPVETPRERSMTERWKQIKKEAALRMAAFND